jgi:hypothetical protein
MEAVMRTINNPLKVMVFGIIGVFLLSAAFFPLRGAGANSGSSSPCVQQQLSQGSEGDCVGYLQTMLNQGNNAGLAVDEEFGTLTRQAVINWQQKMKATKSDMLVDGIVGSQTWSTLCANYSLFSHAASQAGCVKPAATATPATATPAAATTTTTPCRQRTFSMNGNPNDVCNSYIKTMLNEAMGTSLSGNNYGTQTTRAVRFWQQAFDLTVDGIVGPQTWHALCTYNDFQVGADATAYGTAAKKAGC